MDGTGGQVPAQRAVRRPAGPADVPGAGSSADAARIPELAALLGEINALRTALETDLSLAAAAVEAGADDLAGELVDGDRDELRAFSSRAAAHLAALDESAAVEVPALPRRRRPRLLQATPLLAAAAALLGFAAGAVPDRTVAPQPVANLTSAAQASEQPDPVAPAPVGATGPTPEPTDDSTPPTFLQPGFDR